MAQLIVAPQAQADLDEILDCFDREAGRHTAWRFGDRFRAVLTIITKSPGTGAPRANFGPTMRIKTVWP